MAEAGVDGAQQLAELGRRFKAAGHGELRKELLAGIRTSVRKTIPDIVREAEDILPHGGGLAARVAGQKFAARTSLASGKVSLVGSGMKSMTSIDKGIVRHPTFARTTTHSGGNLVGRRMGEWHAQKVTPGFFSKPVEENLPRIREEVDQVMSTTAKKLERPL